MIRIYWLKYFKKNLGLVALLLTLNTSAQNSKELQTKYPNQGEIALEISDHYTISLNNKNQLEISNEAIEDYLILKNGSSSFSTNESIVYSDLVPIKDYEAYTIANEQENFKKIPVKQIKDKPLNSNSVFDSDTKLKVFTFSNLSQGSRKVLKHQTIFKDPMLLHRFIFASHEPSLTRKIKITFDNNIEIGYKIFNDPNNLVSKTVDERKKTTSYVFSIHNAPVYNSENFSAGRSYELPHLHFWIKSYSKNGETTNVLGSVESLYSYYSNFLKNVNQNEDPILKKFTMQLVEGSKNEEEKIKRIYKFVQDQIKYVAFESGYEGFIPRNASLIFERKFGDCKDMASIINEMAKYADVKNVNFAWIGTRELPYTYEELPTPAVDNHMIATYEANNEVIFLDGTDAQVAFGLPSGFIQGKEALIAKGTSYKIVKAPIISAHLNKYEDQYEYTIIDNKIIGKGNLKTHGLTRSSLLNALGDDQKNREKNMKIILERGNDKLNITSFKEMNLAEKELPYTIEYSFENENYAVTAGEETYLNMFLQKPFLEYLFNDERKTTADLERLQMFDIKTSFKIPANSSITYIPENISFENDLLKYVFVYEKTPTEIKLNYQIESKKTFIKPSEMKVWNETIKKLKSNFSETIVIKHL